MTDHAATEPSWRLDAIEEDMLGRLHKALTPFVAEDSRKAAVYAVVQAWRDGPRVEDYVSDIHTYGRRRAVTEAVGRLLASSLPRVVYEQVDMGWLEDRLAVAAEGVYEPVIAAASVRDVTPTGGSST